MIKVKFNLEIYTENNILITRDIYRDYADIRLSKSPFYIEAIFTKCKYDELITVKEFENYLIALENS